MAKSTNPVAIGGFVIGIIGLLIAMGLFFGKGDYFSDKKRFVMYFDGSVKGLQPGAPVTIRGVQIGEVVAIDIKALPESLELVTPVYVDINRNKFRHLRGSLGEQAILTGLIDKGLRAQLRTQSLLTGLLYIEVSFHPNSEVQLKNLDTEYPEFPTVPTELQALTESIDDVDIGALVSNVESIASNLEQLSADPALHQLAGNANQTLAQIDNLAASLTDDIASMRAAFVPLGRQSSTLVSQLNRDLPATMQRLQQSLDQLDLTLERYTRLGDELAHSVSSDSPTLYHMRRAAQAVERSANAVRQLAETLTREPEALIKGKAP